MKLINEELLTGERALFKSRNLDIVNSNFFDGESPLKESSDINIKSCVFEWKYPLWYCQNINVENTTFLETARSGIWYTDNINIKDSTIDAPKTFRKSRNITLENVTMPNALETLWNCNNIEINKVSAKGDYFGINSKDIDIRDLNLSGNYAFDGGKNIKVYDSKIISKDAFWNCENVTVYNSTIIGEYLGWNSKNLTFINCFIKSEQGLCYVENLVIKNSKFIKTDLAFEYSTIDVESSTSIESVKNPIKGKIKAKSIDEVIMDDIDIDELNTKIFIEEGYGVDGV
ncbi:DUF3737 family protein [Clostridium sp. NSJ-145]|uniref:DUF3737 family protein n=1 Tax=Clostridium sp. NSJ-145 TaxID=2897777 RepID=UPI001E3A1B6D|nr:DUF3737 family protein [Clostridium sp. NSJ-145]MCD2503133.1 DUF3737 family protein [Clostridium sp. NSJ-145]